MRGPKDSKPGTYTEGMEVNMADISGKECARYPGRSGYLPLATHVVRYEDGCPEVSRGHSRRNECAEGPNLLKDARLISLCLVRSLIKRALGWK